MVEREIYPPGVSPRELAQTLYVAHRAGTGTVPLHFLVSRESYDYSVLHYLQKGGGQLVVGERGYRLREGDLFILGPGERHYYCAEGSPSLLWVEFYGGDSERLMGELQKRQVRVLGPGENEGILRELRGAYAYLSGPPPHDAYVISRLLYAVLSETLRAGEQTAPVCQRMPEYVRQALEFIDNHPVGDCGVEALAQAVHCSYSGFCRGFKRSLGVSPGRYVTMRAVERAALALEREGCTVYEAAQRFGFCDASYFVKVFKKMTGISPGRLQSGRGAPLLGEDGYGTHF